MKRMKKSMVKTTMLLLLTGTLIGCGGETERAESIETAVSEAAGTDNGEIVTEEVKERGLTFRISQEYADKGVQLESYNENTKGYQNISITYYSPTADQLFDEIFAMTAEERSPEKEEEYLYKIWDSSRTLMEIVMVKTEEYEAQTAEGKQPEDFMVHTPAEWFGTNGDYTYLISIPDLDYGKLTEEEISVYEECKEYMQTVKENLMFIPVEEENTDTEIGDRIPAFVSEDLYGNQVDETIFSEHKLTAVNVWGTFCSPCIEEMPELAQWSENMPDGVGLIGIVGDVDGKEDTEHLELARKITEKAGAEFTNIIGGDAMEELLDGIIGFPTTFFADEEGNIVGEPIVGADVEGYRNFVEEYLNGQN